MDLVYGLWFNADDLLFSDALHYKHMFLHANVICNVNVSDSVRIKATEVSDLGFRV